MDQGLIVGATVNISKTQLIWTEAFQNIKEVNNKYVRILSVFTKALCWHLAMGIQGGILGLLPSTHSSLIKESKTHTPLLLKG